MSTINKYNDLQNARKIFMEAIWNHGGIEKAGNEAHATLYGAGAAHGSGLNFVL